MDRPFIGPPIYNNWIAALDSKPCLGIHEYPLLTDADITGELPDGLGPYKFLNPGAFFNNPRRVRAAIILRVELHMEFKYPDTLKTDTDLYHGGSFIDEIAALSSLALGIRLKAGGLSRKFEAHGDQLGSPVAYYPSPPAIVLTQPHGLVLPSAVGPHSLNYGELELLGSLAKISPQDAIALLRAARLYQDALWIVESEPALAWLMLVSSIEAAANYWCTIKASPLERLTSSKPRLVAYLDKLSVEGVSAKVAEFVADSLGSTKKFIDFVMTFLPSAPALRPAEWGQHPWESKQMKRTMGIIYEYRSKALHGGRPFPAPMCEPPYHHPDWKAPAEKPEYLGAAMKGGSWLAKDTPMLLHTFEYITRNALCNWWKSMAKHGYSPLREGSSPKA